MPWREDGRVPAREGELVQVLEGDRRVPMMEEREGMPLLPEGEKRVPMREGEEVPKRVPDHRYSTMSHFIVMLGHDVPW